MITFRLITVRYTAPVENIFWKRDAMKPIGQKIVKLLYDMNLDSHPLIIHLFSNGGAYLYQNIDLAVKELQTPLDVSSEANKTKTNQIRQSNQFHFNLLARFAE